MIVEKQSPFIGQKCETSPLLSTVFEGSVARYVMIDSWDVVHGFGWIVRNKKLRD